MPDPVDRLREIDMPETVEVSGPHIPDLTFDLKPEPITVVTGVSTSLSTHIHDSFRTDRRYSRHGG